MKRVNYIKKIITVVFLVLFLTVLSINYIFANTAAPTNEQVSEPTEVPNIISSIGDFKLKAQYEDKRNVSENLAINVKKSDINSLSPQIIQSIRAQQGDKDIFLCFELELQMNGRTVSPDTTLDIEIENTDIFGKYQKITVFSISGNEVLKIFPESETDKVKFSTITLGKFVAVGVSINPDNSFESESTASATPTLQNGEGTGIIPTGDLSSSLKNNSSDSISAGAFVFWLLAALVIGIWIGVFIGFVLWGRYKTKKIQRGPYIIGE